MRLFLISLLIAVAAAQECQVSEWGPWSECRYPRNVRVEDPHQTPVTYKNRTANAGLMKQLMAEKESAWDEHTQCMEEGRCPDYSTNTARTRVNCVGGMAGNYPCQNVDMLAYLSLTDLGYNSPDESSSQTRGNDIWGWTDPSNGDEYAILGLTAGTSFIRVSGSGADPENPQVIGHLYNPPGSGRSSWRDMKVVDNKVFIVSEHSSFGLQIFDLTHLRGRSANKNHVFTADDRRTTMTPLGVTTINIANTHNIASNPENGKLFLVGGNRNDDCRAGLKIYNARTQAEDCVGDDGYVHDTECIIYDGPDSRYTGREICFCYNENTFTIIDTEDLFTPIVARTGYSGASYTHQGWATNNRVVLLLDDEQDEQRGRTTVFGHTATYLWNIEDLRAPLLINTYLSSQTAIDHNQYIVGGYTYQSNYEAGLRVLSIDEANYELTEVAWFDVYPSRTTPEFQGTWSNYPYFTNGVVAVTSISPPAMFILRPNLPSSEAEVQAMKNVGYQTRTRSIISSDHGRDCPNLEEFRQC